MAQRLDKYELGRRLGRGAAGTVYEAQDTVLNRRVAIKVVHLADKDELEIKELLQRFLQEAQVASRLSHPGVVGVHNYGKADDVAFIDMEYVDGETLKALLDRGQPPTPRKAVEIVVEILMALDYCHRNGIVHRDIKPANIMLTKDGAVKLADFGIARIENSELTIVGTVMGTPPYMSPEQFAADKAIDFHTDIWSTGVVLYEMLTGAQPFSGDTLAAMRQQISGKPFEPPSRHASGLPPALDQVLARALRKTARDRFPTAAAFAAALRDAMPDDTARPTRPDQRSQRASPRQSGAARRPWIKIAAAGGGILAVIGVVAWLWLGTDLSSGPEPEVATAPEQTDQALNSASPPAADPRIEPEAPPIASQLAAIPCSTVTAATGVTTVFRGVIGSGTPKAALDGIVASLPAAGVRTEVQTFPRSPNLCRMAELVRANPGGGVRLAMFGGRTSLVLGDKVRMNLLMPDFDGEVRVEDLNSQGQVLHLMEAVLGTPPRHLARQQVGLGRDGGDMIGEVDPPFGAELVVAIVSSEPLFTTPRPQDEAPAGYLTALEAAVASLHGRGGRVAMDALVVTTAGK